jgi:phosphoesterase RecJ-like protein
MNNKQKIAQIITQSQSIVIMGHVSGDGDSFGSAIGLKLALEKIGKKAEVVAEDGLPLHLEFLYEYFNFPIRDCFQADCDLIVGVDWSEVQRAACSEMVKEAQKSGIKVAIVDHHTAGRFIEKADCAWVDPKACATAELVMELIQELNIPIDKNIATALMTGIETDTSSFQNQNTTNSCFLAGSTLMRYGARLQNIKKGINADRTVEVLKLWGIALSRLSFSDKYKAAITYLTYQDAVNLGLSTKSINGPTNFLNSIKGAKIVLMMTEEEPGMIKVSLRTRDEHVDVSKLARLVGGGGHVKASAFRFAGDIVSEGSNIKIV